MILFKFFKKMKSYIFLFFLLIFGCQIDQGDRPAMIQELVGKKINEFRIKKLRACYEEIEIEASKKADSILIEKARLAKEQLIKPDVPEKPAIPELKLPFDTSPVAPIIQ